jgi:MacB-like periplasmic core domain
VVVGQPYTGQGFEANSRTVDGHYFQTLQAQLVAGRWFNDSDNADAPQRVIVNKTFADTFLKGLDPVVQQVRFTYSDAEKPRQVIGVVNDIKEAQLDAPALPAIYTPYLESAGSFFYLVVRSSQDAASAIPQTQAAIHQLDPNVVVFQQQTMEDFIQRFPSRLLPSLSSVAGGNVCSQRVGAGERGTVWSGLLLGKPADTGNPHPHGAGGATPQRSPNGVAAGCTPDCPRRGAGHRRRDSGWTPGPQPVVSRERLGPGDLCHPDSAARLGNAYGQLHSRAHRDESRSNGGAQVRVMQIACDHWITGGTRSFCRLVILSVWLFARQKLRASSVHVTVCNAKPRRSPSRLFRHNHLRHARLAQNRENVD